MQSSFLSYIARLRYLLFVCIRYIRSHNRANLSYKLAVNHLADRTQVELKALNGRKYTPGFNGGKPFPYRTKKEIRKAPASFDWRIYGAVTPVKGEIKIDL